jgi:hypothetical protein
MKFILHAAKFRAVHAVFILGQYSSRGFLNFVLVGEDV